MKKPPERAAGKEVRGMDMYAVPECGCLKISVTNINEFNNLLQEAKTEAAQLNQTIQRLNSFRLDIQFSTDQAGDIDAASS